MTRAAKRKADSSALSKLTSGPRKMIIPSRWRPQLWMRWRLLRRRLWRIPPPDLVLKEKAAECEAKADWQGAEARYREVLALIGSTGKAHQLSKAHYDLSRLYLLLGDVQKADACGRLATAAAREAGVFPLLVMALENQAWCSLRSLDYPGAVAAA